jgi:hypothetical protein
MNTQTELFPETLPAVCEYPRLHHEGADPGAETFTFHGHALLTAEREGQIYVAIRPIAEALGLRWGSQWNHIQRDEILKRRVFMMKTRLPGDPRTRELQFLELEYLNGWLFGIDARRVKPELRATILDYQEHCYHALHEHFHGRAGRQQETYWFTQRPHWAAIRPLALQGLSVKAIAARLGMSVGRVGLAIRRMIEVGLIDPVKRLAARWKPATALRLMQSPRYLEWGMTSLKGETV